MKAQLPSADLATPAITPPKAQVQGSEGPTRTNGPPGLPPPTPPSSLPSFILSFLPPPPPPPRPLSST
eukprot:9471289-Pyramimonas_sp.AAC.1